MSAFPDEPVAPRVFIEEVVPALFAEIDPPEEAKQVDFAVGVSLRGEDGGEWTLHVIEGELKISSGLSSDRDVTLVQSVADWRSALWEGRPALFADVVSAIRDGDFARLDAARAEDGEPTGLRNPEALRELESLPGLIEAIVAGAGSEDPDWRVGLVIGPGPIPDTPNATMRIGAAEAESLRTGELHPLEALITGQLRLEGDLGMVIQLQAIAMAASMPPPKG